MRTDALSSLAKLICCTALLSLQGMNTLGADEILGTWFTEDRDSKIEFTPCGEAVCGHVAWLLEPADENGQPYRDVKNPNASLRGRTILGLTIFEGLKRTEAEGPWEGSVYNPEDGESYQTYLKITSNGQLEVKGCVLGGWICDSQYWTRTKN